MKTFVAVDVLLWALNLKRVMLVSHTRRVAVRPVDVATRIGQELAVAL